MTMTIPVNCRTALTLMVVGVAHLLCGAGPSWEGYPRLMQGPMIGWVDTGSINIWMRTSAPAEVQIEYSTSAAFTETKRSVAMSAAKADDYTVVVPLTGLQPGTSYHYRVLINGRYDNHRLRRFPPFEVRTAPAAPSVFKVAFGSCARTQWAPVQLIWDGVALHKPDLFLWLGDNVYADSLDPDIIAEEYRKQRDIHNLQPLLRRVPQLAIWDDHDFGLNDQDHRNPIKNEALRIFRNYWANPHYGQVDDVGVYFSYNYGGVEFFFLDVRYHRSPVKGPDDESKTMLGPRQKAWLKRVLSASEAPFKVIVSGNVWTDEKGGGHESWAAYTTERDEIFRHIADEEISGVLLLAGDTHVGELNCIPGATYGGYDLYELVSSPLAQTPADSWINYRIVPRLRQIFSMGVNFGLLSFDLTAADPTVTLSLHDEYGKATWEPLVLRASELRPGSESRWQDKMDNKSRLRYERSLQGGGYYDSGR